MKVLRQLGSGFVIGAVSLLLVIGGISLSLAETSAPPLPPTPSPIPTTFVVEFVSPLPSPTLPPALPTEAIVFTSTATLALAQPAACSIPANWTPVTVGANDTLYSIADRYKTTVEELNDRNCLNLQNPAPGSVIYVPAVPTRVVAPCSPPAGWVKRHVVQAGENLFRIALAYGITYPQLQARNCMGASTTIFVGQVLWVPNVPTRTPTVTGTFTVTLTSTVNFSTPTQTPSVTPDFSTPTATFIPTASPAPSATPTPSITPFPTNTPSQ